MSVPDPARRLIVIRGNSGSGKSTVATELIRSTAGRFALVEQDYLRRIVLHEPDVNGGDNIALIEQTVQFALSRGYHVVLEGILGSRRYGDMLLRLYQAAVTCHVFYLDVSLEETLRRHTSKSADFSASDLGRWYRQTDLAHLPGELVIPESSHLAATLQTLRDSCGLTTLSVRRGPPDAG